MGSFVQMPAATPAAVAVTTPATFGQLREKIEPPQILLRFQRLRVFLKFRPYTVYGVYCKDVRACGGSKPVKPKPTPKTLKPAECLNL